MKGDIKYSKDGIVIIQGDSFEVMESYVPDNSVDLIVTDPPYLHVKGGMKSKKYNTGTWKEDSYMNKAMSDFGREQIFSFLDESSRVMKKMNMYIFCSKLQLVHYFEWISQHKKIKYDLLVWDKVKYSMKSTKFYTSDIEYIVRIYEAGVSLRKVLNSDGDKSDIGHYLKRQAYERPKGKHSTMKPIEMIENFIRVASDKGDVVMDCFLGSGTTAVACKNTDRKFLGIEINSEYVELSTDRVNEKEEILV